MSPHDFLNNKKSTMADDLWKSLGGHWSESSIQYFYQHSERLFLQNLEKRLKESRSTDLSEAERLALKSLEKLSEEKLDKCDANSFAILSVDLPEERLVDLWRRVVKDFHLTRGWGEAALVKAEPKKLTSDQVQSREIFSYIWALLQAALVTKTAIMYYGIKSTEEEDSSAQYWVIFWIFFSFASLMFFAYRKSRKSS